jgi:hypothetical protein
MLKNKFLVETEQEPSFKYLLLLDWRLSTSRFFLIFIYCLVIIIYETSTVLMGYGAHSPLFCLIDRVMVQVEGRQ